MNTRTLVVFALVTALGVVLGNAYTTYAQSTGEAQAYKIGIVDLQRAADSYTKLADQIAAWQQEADAKAGEIRTMRENLRREFETFAAERAELSEEERYDRETELDQHALRLDAQEREVRAGLDRKHRSIKSALLKDIVEAVEAIGQEEDYHLILEADPETRTGVLFHASAIDMTPKVIERMNR